MMQFSMKITDDDDEDDDNSSDIDQTWINAKVQWLAFIDTVTSLREVHSQKSVFLLYVIRRKTDAIMSHRGCDN